MTGEKHDQGKLRFDLIPASADLALAAVLTYGAKKYEPNGWRQVPDGRQRYTAALFRHLNAWHGGEEKDEGSGLPHLWHAMCNLAFLLELPASCPGTSAYAERLAFALAHPPGPRAAVLK